MKECFFAVGLLLACSACGSSGTDDKSNHSSAGAGGAGSSGGAGGAGSAGGGAGNVSTSGTGGASVTAGGGGSASTTSRVTVSPAMTYIDPGGSQTFTCMVTGTGATAGCTWSVVGGAANGSITADGVYTAPSTLGVAQVQATSKADPTATGTGLAVVKSTTAGVPNVWTNVTPRELNLDVTAFNHDNYGVQDVVADPVRPSDLYAFVCHQGVYKSTDYGVTWTGPINTGAGGAMVTAGKPWTAAIGFPMRDPSTPPTLWTAAGTAAVGVLKSTDGGISWTASATNNSTAVTTGGNNNYYANDAYALDMDPYDGKHLILGFHSGGISESTDGGTSWKTITVPDGIGGSLYPFFIDTGDATTTRGNWVTISQSGGNAGTWHTSDGGATWAQAATFMHGHGGSQLAAIGNNIAYATGDSEGIFKTTDGGAHWTNVSKTGSNAVVATPTKLYGAYGWAVGDGVVDPGLQNASRSADTVWTVTPGPAGLTNGPKRIAVTFDGTHYILVGGFWNTGIWRYIE